MPDFLNYIIKGAVVIITGGVIAIAGFFSHKPVQPTEVAAPAIVNQVQQSSTQKISTSTIGQNAFAPQVQKSKPAVAPKTVAVAEPKSISPAVITTQPIVIQQPIQIPNPLPPEINIDPETFVGILCYFGPPDSATSSGATSTITLLVRGSGVIVNSKGYILTNRHIVVQQDASGAEYNLDHCDVGQLPQGTHLPTVEEIRAINPLVRVPVLAYSAQPVFESSSLPLSDVESSYADFAILKITGVSSDGPNFGITSVPASFPYAKLLPVDQYSVEGQGVVTYGFPGDVTAGQNDAFQTLTMTGSIGTIYKVEVGDSYYADIPLVIMTNMEISHGRSGSPLFWRGYVIGLTTFFEVGNRTDSGSVASDAIIKGLQGTGYLQQ
ncbi:MAG TPA: trypsin-like peptidase domain-containing protein [Candidatus Paceibacterota bacterium]|nr:trypsin-like peptidase domain-containing protein [Candidatus Paceibacterota bacterium]